MPVSPGREVGGVAEEAVGPPDDDVRRAGRDHEAAPRARVLLDGSGSAHRLDREVPAAALLGPAPAEDGLREVALRLDRLRATGATGPVASGHALQRSDPSRGRVATPALGEAQYQFLAWEWAHAPQGVP